MRAKQRREKRLQMAQEAVQLFAAGYSRIEVAKLMGITYSNAANLISDPDCSKQDTRRNKLRPRCRECGGFMSIPHKEREGRSPTGRCKKCTNGEGMINGLPLSAYRRPNRDGNTCWRDDCNGPRDCPEHADQLARVKEEINKGWRISAAKRKAILFEIEEEEDG